MMTTETTATKEITHTLALNSIGSRLQTVLDVYIQAHKTKKRRHMARMMGTDQPRMSYYLNDKRVPDIGKLKRLAHALGINEDWLVFGVGDPETAMATRTDTQVLAVYDQLLRSGDSESQLPTPIAMRDISSPDEYRPTRYFHQVSEAVKGPSAIKMMDLLLVDTDRKLFSEVEQVRGRTVVVDIDGSLKIVYAGSLEWLLAQICRDKELAETADDAMAQIHGVVIKHERYL